MGYKNVALVACLTLNRNPRGERLLEVDHPGAGILITPLLVTFGLIFLR